MKNVAVTAAVFLTGLAIGAGSGRREPIEADAAAPIERVAGADAVSRASRTASGPAGDRSADTVVPSVARASGTAGVDTGDGKRRERVRSREVAHGALGYTAFVRAGNTYGAGVLADRVGHVITCLHVIDGQSSISVAFADQAPVAAKVVEVDRDLDLALLRVSRPDEARVPAHFSSVSAVEMGDDVFSMGAPRKLRYSLSRGLVSYVGRPFGKLYYLQTDLPTNGGNSGGPVINDRGEVIGITSFIYRDTQGLSFALPIDYAFQRFSHFLRDTTLDGARFAEWKSGAKKREAVR